MNYDSEKSTSNNSTNKTNQTNQFHFHESDKQIYNNNLKIFKNENFSLSKIVKYYGFFIEDTSSFSIIKTKLSKTDIIKKVIFIIINFLFNN